MTKSKPTFLMVFLLFFYIYEFNFEVFALPTFITSRRVVVLLLIILLMFRSIAKNGRIRTSLLTNESVRSICKEQLVLQIVLLCYSVLLIMAIGSGEGEKITADIIKYICFSVLPIYLFYMYFNNLKQMMGALMVVTIIQTLIIIACLISPNFANSLDHTFASGETLEYITSHRSMYAGGLSCITAPGAFKYSLGIIACVYFILEQKKTVYLIPFFVFSVVIVMIARTGLILAALGAVVVLYEPIKAKKFSYFLKAGVSILAIIAMGIALLYIFDLGEFFTNRLKRLILLFENGVKKEFFDYYFNGENIGNKYVKINADTFWGIGITSGVAGNGVEVNVDGGFLRLLAALGVPMCSIFYLVFISFVFRMQRHVTTMGVKYTMLFFAIILLAAEFKEYTIYAQYMSCILFTCYALDSKKEGKQEMQRGKVNVAL